MLPQHADVSTRGSEQAGSLTVATAGTWINAIRSTYCTLLMAGRGCIRVYSSNAEHRPTFTAI